MRLSVSLVLDVILLLQRILWTNSEVLSWSSLESESSISSSNESPDDPPLDRRQLAYITQLVTDQVAVQLHDLQNKYQNLLTEFDSYQQQHRDDLETLERRLRDDYAQDMGGMELWMRQEHGHAIQELKQQHRASLLALENRMRQEHDAAIVLLRDELLEQVNVHGQRIQDLHGQVQEGLAIWTSVVDATLQASSKTNVQSGQGRTVSRSAGGYGDGDADVNQLDVSLSYASNQEWITTTARRLRSG